MTAEVLFSFDDFTTNHQKGNFAYCIMPQKKIIIIGPTVPYRGGNSLFVSHLYDALKDKFQVIVYNYKLLYPSLLFPGTTQYDKSKKIIKNVPNTRIINSISPLNWIHVGTKLKKENADLIVFDWWHPFFSFCHFTISYLIRKKYHKKIIFITENVISHESNLIDRKLTKLGLKNASGFLVLSNKVADELENFVNGKKIYKSELPVYDCYKNNSTTDIESLKAELGYSNENKVLLFFGYVRKYKGLDILLETLFDLISSDNSFRLLVVGEFYDDVKNYNEIIKKLKIENYVHIINRFVPNEEVEQYFAVSDCVVLPYKDATQSGVLNIAYGFLKPAVVTNVGGLAEFVNNEKTGVIVKSCSKEEIVKGIKRFYELRNKVNFVDNIKNRVSENSFTKLPQLFDKIVEEAEQ